MKIFKRIFISVLLFLFVFLNISERYFVIQAYAIDFDSAYSLVGDIVELIGADRDITPELIRKAFYTAITQDMGFITKDVVITESEWLRKAWAKKLNELYGGDRTEDSLTQDDYNKVAEYLVQNVTLNDNDKSVTYNDNSKSFLNLCVQEFLDSNKYYIGYSLDLQYYSIPDSCYEFVNEYQSSYDVWCYTKYIGTSAGYRYYFYAYPKQDYGEVLLTVNSDDTLSYKLVNYNTFGNFSPNTYNQSIAPAWAGYVQEKTSGGIDANTIYDITTSSWVNNNNSFKLMQRNYTYRVDDYPLPTQSSNGFALGWVNVTYKTVKAYTIMGTQALFESSQRGEAPYYYNNNVYSNWSNSTGDYTVTYDNSNRITFDDITAHIGDIYGQTGVYPTIPDIEHWIETQPVPTPLPTPTPTGSPSQGGGVVNNNNPIINNNPTINNNPNINITLFPSLSDNDVNGTVSGNGTGGGSGIGNIFGFLSELGKVLGDLIKNLGQALVDVIKGIADLFNSVITELPTVFFDFLGAIFSWLPPEWVTIMSLSFAAMLIIGIIKIFRG